MLKLRKNSGCKRLPLFVGWGKGLGMYELKKPHNCKFVPRLLSMTVVPGHHGNESPRMFYIASSIKTHHRGVIIPVYFVGRPKRVGSLRVRVGKLRWNVAFYVHIDSFKELRFSNKREVDLRNQTLALCVVCECTVFRELFRR